MFAFASTNVATHEPINLHVTQNRAYVHTYTAFFRHFLRGQAYPGPKLGISGSANTTLAHHQRRPSRDRYS